VPQYHFEDFVPGQVREYGPRHVTREEILAFAAEFDPQPMHLDEEAARGSLLGGLAASGWHTCCLMMRMMADGFLLDTASMGSPGVDEVRWLRPVRPDDRLTLRASVREARVSQSRPERGLVGFLFEMHNAQGECVMMQTCTIMIGRRAAKAAPAAGEAQA
jgi:acyl dehydratase